MRWHSTDYKARGDDVRGALVNRGFWLHLPRLTLTCRLAGHEPRLSSSPLARRAPGKLDRLGGRSER